MIEALLVSIIGAAFLLILSGALYLALMGEQDDSI